MSGIDLHIHSTASDGRFSPAELVAKAAGRGLTVMALADHDTVDGIAPALEAARAFPELRVIPAVEINTDVPDGEAHILGYFIDYTDRQFQTVLARLRNSRLQRAQGMLAKLNRLGVHLDWGRVQQIAGGSSLGRPHIAQAMLEKGYIGSFKEAFSRYIGRNGPAYVEREKISTAAAVAEVLRVDGLPVLAHPLTVPDPERMVAGLKPAGLVGLEAYYQSYTRAEVSRLVNLATRYGLITTGGTDYHGLDAASELELGGVDVPAAVAERLIALARQRGSKLV
ncbi:MAG: PHP domain-containing protein [Chloroflexota bacterium]